MSIKTIFIFAAAVLMSDRSPAQSTMVIQVHGLKDRTGQLMIFVYDNAQDFPTKRDHAVVSKHVPISGSPMNVALENISNGTYAVAVYHDENSNGKFDRTWYGMPDEGYGASRDAKGSFGPPKFDDAKFEFPGTQDTINITIHY